jgi:hypothetical protein
MQALEDELTTALAADTGLRESMARLMVIPIVRYLVSEYAGDRIYIPTPGRNYPVAEIRAAFAASRDLTAVCQEYGISRRTLYRILSDPE